MNIGYYMDEHVHSGIVEGLRLRGVDVVTVQEDHRVGRSDEELLVRAGELGRMVFSQDRDFRDLSARLQVEG